MSMHAQIVAALGPVFAGRVYPMAAPTGATLPYATYQGVGGTDGVYLSNAPYEVEQRRVQINVWAATVLEAHAKMAEVRTTLCALVTPRCVPMGGVVDLMDPDTADRGVSKDFAVWAETA